MSNLDALKNLVLAPYILLAQALIRVPRKTGGNQFRHAFMTLVILLDYKYFDDPILLKAALLHDLLEDIPSTCTDQIKWIDSDGGRVAELVLEVTKREGDTKPEYLQRVLENGSTTAKILKIADRISNLTDLHRDLFSEEKISNYLDDTQKFVIPMAQQVNRDMVTELTDLINKRRAILTMKK